MEKNMHVRIFFSISLFVKICLRMKKYIYFGLLQETNDIDSKKFQNYSYKNSVCRFCGLYLS